MTAAAFSVAFASGARRSIPRRWRLEPSRGLRRRLAASAPVYGAPLAGQDAAVGEVADDLLGEKGVARGPFGDPAGKFDNGRIGPQEFRDEPDICGYQAAPGRSSARPDCGCERRYTPADR